MIANKWIGSYRYDNDRHQRLVGSPQTNFEVEFVYWKADGFVGEVVDDPHTGGTPGTGKIIGRISGGRIEFVKEMPVLTMLVNAKRRLTRPDRKHCDIFYSGTLSPDGKSMSGVWKIKFGFALIGGWPAIFFPMSGTWTMTAVEQPA
jgi:hypothetical protein